MLDAKQEFRCCNTGDSEQFVAPERRERRQSIAASLDRDDYVGVD